MSLISCKDLAVGYETGTVAVDINFEVNKGDYLCIVGENGAGKSTLMKTLLGLISPLGGKLSFGEGLKQSEIGYLPQTTPVQQDFPASVYEIVLSGTLSKLGWKPFYTRREKAVALENLERMEISDLKDKAFKTLSGGQRQRVLLARALCATERVLLLDEPVTGLDSKTTSEFYTLVKKLNNEGMTVIMISHDEEGVKKYATHILHVDHEKSIFTKNGGDENA